MAQLSDIAALLDKPNHAVLSTLDADGSVHSTIIWIDVEGSNIAFNSARGRVWPANLARDGRVTLTLLNQDDPYEYAVIKGTAVEVDAGADADRHMDTLAKKYLDQDVYPWRKEGEVRVKFHLAPDRIRHVKA
jgi:PPOX class probable F420-dependent enzyme